jgi:hypothetical protein
MACNAEVTVIRVTGGLADLPPWSLPAAWMLHSDGNDCSELMRRTRTVARLKFMEVGWARWKNRAGWLCSRSRVRLGRVGLATSWCWLSCGSRHSR